MLRQSDLGSRPLQVVVGRSTCVAPDGAACAEEAWQRHHLAKGHIIVHHQSQAHSYTVASDGNGLEVASHFRATA